MSPDRRREIAAKGGRAVHALGLAHRYTTESGRAAGKRGGARTAANREHMAAIGRAGGRRSAAVRAAREGGGNGEGV